MNRNYKLYVHIAPNGKKYYGITKQKPERRWQNGKGYDKNKHFASAIKKYGWDNIQHIVLHEGLDKEEAEELEQYMIQWYNTTKHEYGYNVSLGGETGPGLYGENHPLYGKHLPEEQRKKMSEAKKGAKNPNFGKRPPEETIRKLIEINKKRIHTQEEIEKRRKSMKGKNNPKAKSVICITTNKVFDTVTDGANYYNTYITSITDCCKGKAKTAGQLEDGTRLVWSYLDNYDCNNDIYKHIYYNKSKRENTKKAKIICITTNKMFNTATEGARYYNTHQSSVSSCCKGKIKSSGKLPDGTKLVWRYIDIIEL